MHLLPVLIPLVATFIGMVGAIFSVLGVLRPGRIPRPRRMVHYRVHYDDSLGTRPDIKGVAELVVRRKGHDVPDASLAMIRISNEGGLDIAKEHWIIPISFTFDGRDVVGVEVSDADHVPQGLLTGDQERAWRESRPSGGVLQATADAETIQISKGKKPLELPKIELKRKDRIRLLVLLSGPRDNLEHGVEGGALIKGAVRGGGLVREETHLRAGFYTFGWTGFALVSLVAAILVTFIAATGVASLTEAQLGGIWTGKYTNWRQLGGANRPIDIISRTTDSGTRATFDHKILRMTTEIAQSSQSCTSRDLIPSSPVVRCEKASTDELLKTVNAIPGAIGYAEVHVAEQDEAAKYPNVQVVQLDGRDASPEEVNAGPHSYPFWAVEYMYTDGPPAAGSLLAAFIAYMSTDAAKSVLQSYGNIPCSFTTLCP
jgi:hypothetical protein